MSQPNKPYYTRPPWEWKPPKGVGAAIARGTRKLNEALKKGSKELTESWRLRREDQRRQRVEGPRRLGQNPIARVGDDLETVNSPARTSDSGLSLRTGLSGNLNWMDAKEFAASASADLRGTA